MSLILCSVRCHFLKHLACTTTFLSAGRTRRLNPYHIVPFICSSPLSDVRTRFSFRNLSSTAATFSSSPSSTSSSVPATGSPASLYLYVRIACRVADADVLAETLLCFGASSTSIEEQDTCKHSNDEICITSIYPVCKDVHKSISLAADAIGLEHAPSYEVIMGYQSDWIKETQESFHPVKVTEGLWIVPEWRTPPDLQATNVILNPGLAFGTGDHATTKLCLLLLHGLIKGGEQFLDYGTGSGVLAIAAVKFGAALSVGFDIDPQAITASCHNAALNNIEPEMLQLHLVPKENGPPLTDKMTAEDIEEKNLFSMGVIPETQKFDVVVANILLTPLLELADEIVSYAKPRAVVGLSGIISEQIPYIIERYSQLLEGITVSKMDDWACVRGTKKVLPVHEGGNSAFGQQLRT